MAQLRETFSVDTLPQSDRSYDPLPAGWYDAEIAGAEIRQTKAGTGEYIAVRYDITGPTHAGRVIFGNLNISNANPAAEKIGKQQLGELMLAIGLKNVSDTDQLIGHRCSIKLAVRKSEEYGDSNDVKGWKAVAGGAPPAAAAAPSPAPAPQAPAGNAPPWANRA